MSSDIDLEHVLARTFERLDASFHTHEQRMLSIVQTITSKSNRNADSPMWMTSTDANDGSQPESRSFVLANDSQPERRPFALKGPCSGDTAMTSKSDDNDDLPAANVGSQSGKSPVLEEPPSGDKVYHSRTLSQVLNFDMAESVAKCRAQLDIWGSGSMQFLEVADIKESRLLRIVQSPWFRQSAAVVITFNAFFVGWELDELGRTIVNSTTKVPSFFLWAGCFFTGMFALELMLRMMAFKWSFFLPRSSGDKFWNAFDTIVVVASITSLTLELHPDKASLSSLDIVSTFRLFRVFRLLRVLRVVRLLGVCPGLRILTIAVVEAVKQSGHLFMLLLLVVYVFAIVFVQQSLDTLAASDLYKTHQDIEDQQLWKLFGTLPRGMETLFQAICGGRDWGDFSLELSNVGWATVAMFHFYIATVIIVVMNVITGLFCQSACAAALTDQNEAMLIKLKEQQSSEKRLRNAFQKLDDLSDVSPDGAFTFAELERGMSDATVKALFSSLEIDVDDAWTLFKLLDTNRKGYIDIDRFLDGCKKCRGNARSIDTHLLRYEVQWLIEHVVNMSKKIATLGNRIVEDEDRGFCTVEL